MKPKISLHLRIALVALCTLTTVLIVSFQAVEGIIESVVADNVDVKMDTQIQILSRSLNEKGLLDATRLQPYAEIAQPPLGWGWDVASPSGHWARGTAPKTMEYPQPRIHPVGAIYSGRGTSQNGLAIRARRIDPTPASPATSIRVFSPRSLIDHDMSRLMHELYKVIAEVVLVLVTAAILQLRLGLRPLRKLISDVALVRHGEAVGVPENQPSDLHLLASEINALIARNQAGLNAARLNAANLAHAVKTPLASLALRLDQEGASMETRQLVSTVAQKVAHHLQRARSAAISLGSSARADAVAVIDEVVSTMRLVHRHRAIAIEAQADAGLIAAVESADLAEMLGNLVDNAARYAHSRVVVIASATATRLCIRVEDDGDGIAAEELSQVFAPGVRLDDGAGHYGFGLAIVRDLALQYCGDLQLENAQPKGLRAILDLPLHHR